MFLYWRTEWHRKNLPIQHHLRPFDRGKEECCQCIMVWNCGESTTRRKNNQLNVQTEHIRREPDVNNDPPIIFRERTQEIECRHMGRGTIGAEVSTWSCRQAAARYHADRSTFGNKSMLLSGDFRQVLVVREGKRWIKNSQLWHHFT